MLLLQPHLVLLQSNHLRPHPIRHRPTNRGKFLQSNCQPIGEIEPIPPHRIHPRQTIRILPVKTILHRILPTIHVQIATRLRLQIQRSIRDRIWILTIINNNLVHPLLHLSEDRTQITRTKSMPLFILQDRLLFRVVALIWIQRRLEEKLWLLNYLYKKADESLSESLPRKLLMEVQSQLKRKMRMRPGSWPLWLSVLIMIGTGQSYRRKGPFVLEMKSWSLALVVSFSLGSLHRYVVQDDAPDETSKNGTLLWVYLDSLWWWLVITSPIQRSLPKIVSRKLANSVRLSFDIFQICPTAPSTPLSRL